jgi:hypothetical protein
MAEANGAFYGRRLKEARSYCQQAIDRDHFSEGHLTPVSVRYFLNRTACDIGLHDYQSAKKSLEVLQKYLGGAQGKKELVFAVADCDLLRAELAYKSANSKEALPLY